MGKAKGCQWLPQPRGKPRVRRRLLPVARGGERSGGLRGSHKGCGHKMPAPMQTPRGRQLGPRRLARVVSGDCRVPGASSTTPPPRADPGAAALSPARPARTKPPHSPATAAASRRRLLSYSRSSSRLKSRRRGAGGSFTVTHSAAAPGIPLPAPTAAPRLPPCARAPGSGSIAKLPPPVRTGESVKLPSSIQLPQPSRCLSPSPGRPGPAPGCS